MGRVAVSQMRLVRIQTEIPALLLTLYLNACVDTILL